MTPRAIVIGSYPTQSEAAMVQGVLKAHGVESHLDNVTMGTLLGGYLGPAVGGVQVRVREEDVERATEVLAAGHPGADEGWVDEVFGGDEGEPWRCLRCDARVGEDLTHCWSCGATRDGTPDPDFEAVAAPAEARPASGEPEDESGEPGDDDIPAVGSADPLARTAWRMAVIGLILLPPTLHVLSLVYLARAVLGERRLSPRARWIALRAFLVDLFVIAAVVAGVRFVGVTSINL